MSAGAPADGDAVVRAVATILADEEFSTATEAAGTETQVLGELFDAALGTLEALLGGLRSNHPELFVLVLVVALSVVAASIWVGARALARRRHGDGAGAAAPGSRSIADEGARLRARANQLAAEGAYLAAARAVFRASIIERALSEGLLARAEDAARFRLARTYRELVGEFSRSESERLRLESLASRLEAGVYGGRPFGEPQWREVFELAEGSARQSGGR